jgi:hypothetical protein
MATVRGTVRDRSSTRSSSVVNVAKGSTAGSVADAL